jgi:hypothetical protein
MPEQPRWMGCVDVKDVDATAAQAAKAGAPTIVRRWTSPVSAGRDLRAVQGRFRQRRIARGARNAWAWRLARAACG